MPWGDVHAEFVASAAEVLGLRTRRSGWLDALGAKPDPLTGTFTAPSESTLRRAQAGGDAAELQRLTAQ